MKKFMSLIVAMLMLFVSAIPAYATVYDSLVLVFPFKDDDSQGLYSAVLYNDNGSIRVLTSSDAYRADSDGYMVVAGDDYDVGALLEYVYELEDGLTVFRIVADPDNVASMAINLAERVQVGEELTYYFYVIDDVIFKAEGQAVIKEDGSLSCSVGDVNPEYPAIAVNKNGELVLIHTADSFLLMCDSIDEAPSNPPDPENPPTTSEPKKPSKSESPSKSSDGPISRTPSNNKSSKLTFSILFDCFVLGLLVGLLVVCVRLLWGCVRLLWRWLVSLIRKKASSGSVPAADSVPSESVTPVPPTEPIPQKPDVIEPENIDPHPKSSVLYLYCEGGVMDGKRYQIGTDNIIIGRDPSSNIRYPADTAGISRRHCQVFWKNGVLHIMDLGSTAGTFIRGKGKIADNIPIALNAGDTFYIGEKRNAFVLRMESEV